MYPFFLSHLHSRFPLSIVTILTHSFPSWLTQCSLIRFHTCRCHMTNHVSLFLPFSDYSTHFMLAVVITWIQAIIQLRINRDYMLAVYTCCCLPTTSQPPYSRFVISPLLEIIRLKNRKKQTVVNNGKQPTLDSNYINVICLKLWIIYLFMKYT